MTAAERRATCASLALALALLGCDSGAPGDDGGAPPADASLPPDAAADAGPLDGGSPDGGPLDGGAGSDAGPEICEPRVPAPADGPRRLVVSHPFTSSGGAADGYEVLDLAVDGTLTRTGASFAMRRAFEGRIVFTPDGEVGLVAQDDGTIGVFRLEPDGSASPLQSAYDPGFYVSSVHIDPDGGLWALDPNWVENGGGIVRLLQACDGRLRGAERVGTSRLAYGLEFAESGRAIVAAREVLGAQRDLDIHVLDLAAPSALGGADVFERTAGQDDDDWIGAGFTLTRDGRFAILGDNSSFSSVPNRLGVARLDGDAISVAQLLPDVPDPVAIIASPFDDVVLVVDGFGNAIRAFDYAPDDATPLSLRGELAYTDRRPALPNSSVAIRRGALDGLVFVAENLAIRVLRFEGAGVVTDLGPYELGAGSENIPGAIGVTP